MPFLRGIWWFKSIFADIFAWGHLFTLVQRDAKRTMMILGSPDLTHTRVVCPVSEVERLVRPSTLSFCVIPAPVWTLDQQSRRRERGNCPHCWPAKPRSRHRRCCFVFVCFAYMGERLQFFHIARCLFCSYEGCGYVRSGSCSTEEKEGAQGVMKLVSLLLESLVRGLGPDASDCQYY